MSAAARNSSSSPIPARPTTPACSPGTARRGRAGYRFEPRHRCDCQRVCRRGLPKLIDQAAALTVTGDGAARAAAVHVAVLLRPQLAVELAALEQDLVRREPRPEPQPRG